MSNSLGDLYFTLGLDDKKFNDAIKAAKQKIEGLGADISGGINVDANKVAKKVKDELGKLNGLTGGDKTIGLSVQVKEDTLQAVRSQLEALEAQRTVKLSVEYDNEKFQAATTTLKNYTDSLNNLGKIRLGIDDSFLRTGVSSNNGKGLKGFLGNMSDYLFGDDTGDVSKSIGQIQKVLNNYTFKLKAVIDEQLLINSLNSASKKKIPLGVSVNIDIDAIQKKLNNLKAPLTFNSKQAIDDLKANLKKETFKGKLELVIDKAKVSKAVKAALEKQGLNYNTTASDVRAVRIEEIQQKMEHRQKKFDGQVKKSVQSTNKLGTSMRHASDWAGQLANQFSNFISIYAIERFVRNLYTIGGEFQKQQIALRNMIGDADKGNAIFERMKTLAVKSPFTFSELSSYTKQMAAYGIEYENLYDTTKRLADISAGVGVDMGRLILAYGQVRSAEVLRGQELRQFTEAGIPLVAELAKRLSEVRGEAVKVGEVFGAISKRQVSFEMVKDVLFDMTDPGGRFFAMQEELAKSLAGQWSNLKDAWDITIADIANSSNNELSNLAGVAADILRNWRDWIPTLAAIASAIGFVTSAIRIATTATTIWNAVTSASPWMKVISVILGVAGAIGGYNLASSVAKKNTSQVNSELEAQVQKWSENRSNALRYIDTIKSSNTSEERRIQLYNELLKLYPSIFENMKMEQVMLADTASLKTQVNDATKTMSINEITKLIKEERKKIREAEGDSVERGTFNGQEYKITRKALTDEQKAIIQRAEARIAELEAKAAEIQKNITREGLIEKLTPDSSISKYIEVYHNLAKAVKILRQGGVKGEISNPKEFITTLEYYDQLNTALKEQEEISKKFKIGTPERTDADKLIKVYRDAISAIGGIWNTSKSKGRGVDDAAKLDIQAYIEALKNEISKIGSQWDLYKQLFEKTGDMKFAASAFKTTHVWDDAAKEMHNALTEAAKSQGIDWDIDYDISDADAKTLYKDLYNSWKEIKDRIERNGVDLKVNAADAISESKDFAAQIEEIERKLQDKLQSLRVAYADDPEKLKRAEQEAISKAEEEKTKVRFEEFKKGSDWVKVFDDLDRVSDATLDNMIVKVEEFAKQAHLSEEVTKQLVEAMAKLRDKAIERNPFEGFKNAWGRLSYWKNYDVNAAYNKRYNDKTGKFEQKLSKEEIENLTKEANSDVVKASLGVIGKFDEVAKAADLLGGLFDSLGLSVGDTLGILSDVLGSAASGAKTGADIVDAFGIKNAGPWGAIAGAAIGMMSSLFASHDKALQREIEASEARAKEIERMADNIESLLQRTMGGIYTFALDEDSKKNMQDLIDAMYVNDVLGNKVESNTKKMYSEETRKKAQEALDEDSYFDAQMATLMATRDELNEQLRLEQKKKNEDASKISDYEQEIKNIGIEIDNLANDMANTLYGIDFKDWAGRLAESLVDAWASGEDAVLAYKNTVDEILRDVGVSVISQQLIEERLAPIMDDFMAQFAKDNGEITSETMSILERMYGEAEWAADATEAYLEGLKKLGVDLADKSEEASGGLSKSVQGVTEDTANLLGSYLNAIRQSVHVKQGLLEKLVSDDVPRISYIAEAQLRELSQIQTNTAKNVALVGEIRDLVNRVVDKGSNKLKV